METRRVFRQGSSVAIVIPTRYVEELGIEAGDLLGFDMTKERRLRLRPLRVEDWNNNGKESEVEP